MNTDGQQYLRCEECGEYVNSSEAAAHRCAVSHENWEGLIDLGDALAIVLSMARTLVTTHGEISKPDQCPVDATTAMDTVDDFIANYFGDVERWRCRVCRALVAPADIREHLAQHNPDAGRMDFEDVAAQYEASMP